MSSATAGLHAVNGNFRPDIEGMRGIAVLLVVLFHSGVPGFGGGFVGVDVFFALSGYLITALIVREIEQTSALSFQNFYARRVRRLLPASGLLVVTVLLLAAFVYSPIELAQYANWAKYTSLYISNLMFMRDAINYFASDSALNPFLHTWSLAVEEQFYLFWPAMILASMTLFKSRLGLAKVLVGICVVSFGMCLGVTYLRQPWAFFSLPTRAWEFAFGGLACLLSQQQLRARARWINPLGWAGLAGVVASGCLYSAQSKFPGYAATLPIVGTTLVLISGASKLPSSLQTLLGTGALQYLGRLSYSWYLWHWPLLLFSEAVHPHMKWQGRVVVALFSLCVAQISFWLVERPIRFSPFLVARPVLSLSLAVILAAPGIAGAGLAQRKANSALRSPEQASYWAAAHDTRLLFDSHCLIAAGVSRVRECQFGDPGGGRLLVLLGDSHAEQWFPAVDVIAREKHWRITTILKSACPAARVQVYSVTLKREDTWCTVWREAALKRIVELKPYIVILSETDIWVRKGPERGPYRGHLLSAEQWKEGLRSTVAYLNEHGLKTLIIADVPRANFDVPTCLSRAAAHSWGAQECVIHREASLNSEARQAQSAATEGIPGVKLIDFTDQFCPGPICQPQMGGQVVYRDDNHMTSNFAQALAPLVRQQIDSFLPAE